MKEIIRSYSGGEIILQYDDNLTGLDEIRYSQGYVNRLDFASPFFYVNNDIPIIEIKSYRKKEKDQGSIVSLWDHNEELFEFHCNNSKEEFDCVKEFFEISYRIVDMEYKLKQMYQMDE